MKVVIIGGVAAGMSAAAKAKRVAPQSEVVVIESTEVVSYGACGLPYYASGENPELSKLVMRTPEDFRAQGITVLLRHEVLKVDPVEKTVMVKALDTGAWLLEPYDRLLIATGASPILPALAGAGPQVGGIMALKTLEDAVALKAALENPGVRSVVVVGAGYIGIEVAEAAVTQGKQVTVLEASMEGMLRSFDAEMLEGAYDALARHGVALRLGERLLDVTTHGNTQSRVDDGFTQWVSGVLTDKGTLPADLVVLALGVRPNTSFLKGSGIQLTANGAVLIDREMRTSAPDVYAAGDCATVYHAIKQEQDYIPLGTTANKCGRIAGANLVGGRQRFTGTLGAAAIKVFDRELSRVGLSEREAKAGGFDYATQKITANNHPGYYPGAVTIEIKLIYEKRTLRLLGAQLSGPYGSGAVLRGHALSVAIAAGMTVDALRQVDMAYAPPFSGVWDAIAVAANAVKVD